MKIGGFTHPDTLTFDGHTLRWNGGGERTKLFIKIYVMSLYTGKSINNHMDVIKSEKPIAIRMTLATPLVTNSLLADTIVHGYKRATNNDTRDIQTEIDKVIAKLTDGIVKYGDYFDIVYTPENGMSFYKNDEYLGGGNKDSYLKESTFKIWFGDNTSDLGLRKKMLKGY